MEKHNFAITPKGLALIAAVESGLCPEVEGGYDTDAFDKFWGAYQDELRKNGLDESQNFTEVFNDRGVRGVYKKYWWVPWVISTAALIVSIITLAVRLHLTAMIE